MSIKKPSIHFLALKIFSFTGGIEKMSRVVCRALYELEEEGKCTVKVSSMYDLPIERDSRYTPAWSFKGYGKQKIWFVIISIIRLFKTDVVIISHVNLLFIAAIVSTFKPSIRIYLFAHGIEIWPPLNSWQKFFLRKMNVLAVSTFTKNKIVEVQGLNPQKVFVLNNALDPFYEFPASFEKPKTLLTRYEIAPQQSVLFTLTRLANTEKYKGYDLIIEVLPAIIKQYPNLRYLIGGKYDEKEKARLNQLILQNNLEENVKLLGFLDEIELTEHFLLADTFIMPSKKEGFGIVFIEAMASGLQVIGGNQDGTTDALDHGKLGVLINPEDKEEVKEAILKSLEKPLNLEERKALQEKCIKKFSFIAYKKTLEDILF